jgi:RNA polymerase sigma-70 factor (ECF subfamily)
MLVTHTAVQPFFAPWQGAAAARTFPSLDDTVSTASYQSAEDSPNERSPELDRDEALRAQRGDTAALDALVRRHHAGVARLLWKFARQTGELDDLVQETFLRVVKHLHTWRAEKPFEHWLMRIAANTGRDYCRRQSVRRRWRVDPPVPRDGESAAPAPEAVDPGLDPSARAAADEIKEILATLPPDDCAVLTLHHLEGWDLATIARQFGWTVTATKLRAWRARARLRALL